MTPRGRGANPNVLRAIGLAGAERNTAEVGSCRLCQSTVEFTLGEFGQTLERCTNGLCDNRAWHPPIPPLFQQ